MCYLYSNYAELASYYNTLAGPMGLLVIGLKRLARHCQLCAQADSRLIFSPEWLERHGPQNQSKTYT